MSKFTGMLACLLLAGLAVSLQASDVMGIFKVEKVQSEDRVQLNFNRLPISVRLAHVQVKPEGKSKLEELLKDKSVTLKYVDELGSHESGDPYVYIFVAGVNINVKLVESGVATYDPSVAKSKLYDTEFTHAQELQEKMAKLNPGASATPRPAENQGKETPTKTEPAQMATGGTICAELNGSFYHLSTCPKAQQLSTNNKIFFASPEAAEKAGKRPCWTCLAARADELAFGKKDAGPNRNLAQKVGYLIGLKSDPKLFFSPTAPRLKSADISDMVGFSTVREAKASGRQPDPQSLRLTRPEGEGDLWQAPKDGECIGRSPPFYRPCFRAPANESGLCSVCEGLDEDK